MSFKSLTLAALATAALAMPAFAEINLVDPYARVSTPTSKNAGAFMIITNSGDEDDRLVGLKADISARTEMHTHKEVGDGVMKMMEVEEGFVIPAGGEHGLVRGGDHVMFMGLHNGLSHGDTFPVTFVFEKAGEITIDMTVDLERKPMHGKKHKHKH
ncbi:MAG: copper chaperone PCu(A)C [Shimia sp.]|nr:copper chaperone PCu(A)C [Shimia sp.]